MRVAAETPVETMRACAKVMDAATAVAEHGNPSAQSDIAGRGAVSRQRDAGGIVQRRDQSRQHQGPDGLDRIVADAKQISGDASEAAGTIMQEANVVDLMRAVAKRVGMHHAAPPETRDAGAYRALRGDGAEMPDSTGH
jgi:hypothetical protein